MTEKNNIDPMTDLEPNLKQINGPINVVRLEGNIHGIKKIVYLFMDNHANVHSQTECENIFSKDLHKYFLENFRSLNNMPITYDFFLEIVPTDISEMKNMPPLKFIYLMEVRKLFVKTFRYEEKEDKVKISDLFRNVRLHYLDIRDYMETNIYFKLMDAVYISERMNTSGLNSYDIANISNILKEVAQQLKTIMDIFEHSSEEIKNRSHVIKSKTDKDEQVLKQLVYKIKYRYNYTDIKNIINDELNHYTKLLSDFVNFIEYATKEMDIDHDFLLKAPNSLIHDTRIPMHYNYSMTPFIITDILKKISDFLITIETQYIFIFARITDTYLLRRLLDKDYITNAIIYTGINHSLNYINILVKDFDFKVTHAAYSNIENIDDLNKEIKNTPLDEIAKFFSRPYLYQCSDITHFPENFL